MSIEDVERSLHITGRGGWLKTTAKKLKVLKERAEYAIWFAKSFGLGLSHLTFTDVKLNETYSYDYQNPITKGWGRRSNRKTPKGTDSQNSQIEQILFCCWTQFVSNQSYHKLTVVYEDMSRSYLIKGLMSDLNKMTHIGGVPGIYPGAQSNVEECSHKMWKAAWQRWQSTCEQ